MNSLSRFSFFLFVLISVALNAGETVQLTTPNLSDDNIIGYNVGLRPYRASGIRIDLENYEGKSIIHNYGHGGAGISLSWGSAMEAIALAETLPALPKRQPIAILGSGVIGLSTAYQLLEKGYKVRIYAKEFPPYTTSEVAAGLWDAFGVAKGDTQSHQERFERIKNASHNYFLSLAVSPVGRILWGVSEVNSYSLYNGHEIEIEFSNGKRVEATRSKHLMIETPTYMSALVELVKDHGAEFVPYTVDSKQSLLELSESVIFNCMGLGSKKVFGDDELTAIRGQLIYFKAQAGVDYLAGLSLRHGPIYTCLFPYKNKFILGGSYEVGETQRVLDQDVLAGILKVARSAFNQERVGNDEL